MKTLTVIAVAAGAVALVPAAASSATRPATIPLPNGFQPEGIAAGKGNSLFVGSISNGAIFKADSRTGRGGVLVPGREGRSAIGIKVDRRRKLIVAAGGMTGKAYVYDARTGANRGRYQLAPRGAETFVNDVTLTGRGAFFTDSRIQQIYRVQGAKVQTIKLTGDIVYGAGNNANGIVAARGGKTLITVQSNTGKLFRIDPKTGFTRTIDLGGASLVNGDGLLLEGRTLYVVQNRLNKIAVVKLDGRLKTGRVVREISNPAFDVPTTLTRSAGRLYTVNARFGIAPSPDNRYDVVKVR